MFRANVYGPLDGGMVMLQSAVGRFDTKKLYSRLYSIEIFEPAFGGFRVTVRTPSIARWKARSRLPIRHS